MTSKSVSQLARLRMISTHANLLPYDLVSSFLCYPSEHSRVLCVALRELCFSSLFFPFPYRLNRTADRLGRRYAMVVECMLFIVGVIIQITTTAVWQQLAVGRFVSGLAVGALSAAVPMVDETYFHIRSTLLTYIHDSTKQRLLPLVYVEHSQRHISYSSLSAFSSLVSLPHVMHLPLC
jgi:hypothetical protein